MENLECYFFHLLCTISVFGETQIRNTSAVLMAILFRFKKDLQFYTQDLALKVERTIAREVR